METDLVGVLEYPDHHDVYGGRLAQYRRRRARRPVFVTTEKDLVKLERFPFERDSLYALRLEVVMDLDDETRLVEMIVAKRAHPRAPSERQSRPESKGGL